MEIILMPRLGMTMESAEIVEWLKRENNSVESGEPLLEVSTDKASTEVESPITGVIARLLVQEGEVIDVGVPIAVIAAIHETVTDEAIDQALTNLGTSSAAPPQVPSEAAEMTADISLTAGPAARVEEPQPTVRATPRVRKLAQELGIGLASITPSGPDGSITEDDVARASKQKQGRASGAPIKIRERQPITGARRQQFARMTQAWQTIPHFHQIIDIDARPLQAARKQHNVTMTAYFVRAAALALARHPLINASIVGDEAVLYSDININVAVGAESGLIVPVIHHADHKSLPEIATELKSLAERARSGQLTPDDLAGGTFTISNLGMYGIETGTPVINPPQVALMFVGSTQTIPVMEDDTVVAGQRIKITLSYDHRLIDGIAGATFSQAVRQLLHTPDQL